MNRIILVLVAIGMVACNVEEGEDSTTQTSSSRSSQSCTPRSYEEMTEYGWGCWETLPEEVRRDSIGSNNTSGSSTSGGSSSGVSRSANIAQYAEYEPNNALENANPVAFPSVSGDIVPGIKITGSVHDTSDASDYFILTPNQGGTYAIYLCGETCMEHPTDSMVAISVIDQFGTVIVENPLFEESTKILTADFLAGLPYYVQIIGFDTGDQPYPYELVIID